MLTRLGSLLNSTQASEPLAVRPRVATKRNAGLAFCCLKTLHGVGFLPYSLLASLCSANAAL